MGMVLVTPRQREKRTKAQNQLLHPHPPRQPPACPSSPSANAAWRSSGPSGPTTPPSSRNPSACGTPTGPAAPIISPARNTATNSRSICTFSSPAPSTPPSIPMPSLWPPSSRTSSPATTAGTGASPACSSSRPTSSRPTTTTTSRSTPASTRKGRVWNIATLCGSTAPTNPSARSRPSWAVWTDGPSMASSPHRQRMPRGATPPAMPTRQLPGPRPTTGPTLAATPTVAMARVPLPRLHPSPPLPPVASPRSTDMSSFPSWSPMFDPAELVGSMTSSMRSMLRNHLPCWEVRTRDTPGITSSRSFPRLFLTT
mmetsp:Transcript_5265/g.14938  ORF Transcript_5265/g.14938 Transcript_5265/m.14938 type:complete len:313 (+) Transcript_5265:1122-2060(+)